MIWTYQFQATLRSDCWAEPNTPSPSVQYSGRAEITTKCSKYTTHLISARDTYLFTVYLINKAILLQKVINTLWKKYYWCHCYRKVCSKKLTNCPNFETITQWTSTSGLSWKFTTRSFTYLWDTCRTICAVALRYTKSKTNTNPNPDPNRYRRHCPDPNARIQTGWWTSMTDPITSMNSYPGKTLVLEQFQYFVCY